MNQNNFNINLYFSGGYSLDQLESVNLKKIPSKELRELRHSLNNEFYYGSTKTDAKTQSRIFDMINKVRTELISRPIL